MSTYRCPSTVRRPSVTATDMAVAPIAIPTKRTSEDRSTSVERRPPREAAGPAASASPSSANRATSLAIVVRETPSRSASSTRDSGPSSRSVLSTFACVSVSGLPASVCRTRRSCHGFADDWRKAGLTWQSGAVAETSLPQVPTLLLDRHELAEEAVVRAGPLDGSVR